MRPRDTSPEAHDVQIEFYRRLSPAKRLELGIVMCDEARRISRDAIRARHPEYTHEEVRYALFRLTLGDELFRKAWPDAPLLAP